MNNNSERISFFNNNDDAQPLLSNSGPNNSQMMNNSFIYNLPANALKIYSTNRQPEGQRKEILVLFDFPIEGE